MKIEMQDSKSHRWWKSTCHKIFDKQNSNNPRLFGLEIIVPFNSTDQEERENSLWAEADEPKKDGISSSGASSICSLTTDFPIEKQNMIRNEKGLFIEAYQKER